RGGDGDGAQAPDGEREAEGAGGGGVGQEDGGSAQDAERQDGEGLRGNQEGRELMADNWVKLKTSVRDNDRIGQAVRTGGVRVWAVFTGLIVLHAERGSHG